MLVSDFGVPAVIGPIAAADILCDLAKRSICRLHRLGAVQTLESSLLFAERRSYGRRRQFDGTLLEFCGQTITEIRSPIVVYSLNKRPERNQADDH